MIPLPKTPTEAIALADWIEITALVARDQSCDRGELEAALQRAGVFASGSALEARILDVFTEIEARQVAAGDGYAFDLSGNNRGVLRLRTQAYRDCSSYLFCLCLAYFGERQVRGRTVFAERVFESICTEAARRFLAGDAVRIGHPRHATEIDSPFGKAVDALCVRLQEGGGFVRRSPRKVQDDGVDIVAWRHENDEMPGKLVIFGGCASGADWPDKLKEVDPDTWCDTWLKSPLGSKVLRAFFVPFRLPGGDAWTDVVRRCGLLFDRCRISRWARRVPANPHGDARAWMKAKLQAAA